MALEVPAESRTCDTCDGKERCVRPLWTKRIHNNDEPWKNCTAWEPIGTRAEKEAEQKKEKPKDCWERAKERFWKSQRGDD